MVVSGYQVTIDFKPFKRTDIGNYTLIVQTSSPDTANSLPFQVLESGIILILFILETDHLVKIFGFVVVFLNLFYRHNSTVV